MMEEINPEMKNSNALHSIDRSAKGSSKLFHRIFQLHLNFLSIFHLNITGSLLIYLCND